MIFVEFLKDYKLCHQKGDRRWVTPEMALMLEDGGYAKSVERVAQNKMVEKPVKEK